jgi:hypothetical protein
MKKELIKLANHLDRIGFTKEADFIDNLLKKAEDSYQDIVNILKACGKSIPEENSLVRSDFQNPTLKRELQGGLNELLGPNSFYTYIETLKYSDTVFGFENKMDDTSILKYSLTGEPSPEAVKASMNISEIVQDETCLNANLESIGKCKVYFKDNLRTMYIVYEAFSMQDFGESIKESF